MIIGITGYCQDINGRLRIAGAGKDEVAKVLVSKYNFISLAWADPLKRFCKEVFDFKDEALWGGSELRTTPDKRYPRPNGGYLTSRFALQSLGSGWGRECYLDVWVDYGIRTAKKILSGIYYTPQLGLCHGICKRVNGVVFSDVRFCNEFNAIKKAGGYVIRVKRQLNIHYNDAVMDMSHNSETDVVKLPDSDFDFVIDNNGTLLDLGNNIDNIIKDFVLPEQYDI